jgi:hypothetical protein
MATAMAYQYLKQTMPADFARPMPMSVQAALDDGAAEGDAE